jgi:predicted component of viral defense system (DUF524 family)
MAAEQNIYFDALKIPVGVDHHLLIAKAGLKACSPEALDELPSGWRGVPETKDNGPLVFDPNPAPGFQKIQLFENDRYFLSVDAECGEPETSDFELEAVTGAPGKYHFQIANYLGTAWIRIADSAELRFDVISRKIDYASGYRSMVEDIAGQCNQLLLDWDTPTSVNIVVNPDQQKKMLLEQFLFLHHSLGPDKLDLFLEILRRNPHLALESEYRWRGLGEAPPAATFFINPLAASRDWSRAPAGMAVASGHAPQQVRSERKYDSADTPPNQFVKFALQTFHDLCDQVVTHREIGIGKRHEGTAAREALVMREYLEGLLAEPFFMDVGRLNRLPLNSQPLQKREGYRDVLRAWLMLELAAQLDWEGRNEAYDGTNRDVPTLYEYWLYFVMRSVLGKVNELDEIRLRDDDAGESFLKPFVTEADSGLRINLKQGQASVSAYRWRKDGSDDNALRVHFYYNRSFSRQKVLSAGSYSRTFRPDYSLVIFPESLAGGGRSPTTLVSYEDTAEQAGQIAYLHFDAKYRVEKLAEFFGSDNENDDDLSNEHRESAANNTYRRGDLYKMHTYNEAIRRTVGSYVLYPGTDLEHKKTFERYHEALPGVGAFVIRPVPDGDDELGASGVDALASFINDVLTIQRDRFSQLYRLKYWEHDTVKKTPASDSAKPDRSLPVAESTLPPADARVTIGYVRARALSACRKKGIFYFHARYEEGKKADRYDPLVLGARYFVPQCRYGPVGWYGSVKAIDMVTREEVESLVGAGSLGPKHADPQKRPTHYFRFTLEVFTGTIPVSRDYWKEFILEKNAAYQGAPFTCSWADLWGR